ncbi:MAG: Inorganic triphosphatase [Chroococcopsis gigantea SAG 12.99]|jgi:adenylate cyclase|nr:CYTH domain-containing protein [Chlorogloea purpurea SAG 13.99]MDV3001326.1 Inorganic triphosphatase [Chroococcopsis gigantea SAG 12.99]
MAVEIERKFLVVGDEWKKSGTAKVYRQGYINRQDGGNTVRIRQAGERGYITIKGKTQGIARAEFEYEIPLADAEDMLETLCDRPLIEKVRYRIPLEGLVWEVDEFSGDNEGLIIAEVELDRDDRAIVLPRWIGKEVTRDKKYYNVNLIEYPYKDWTDK